MSHGRFCASPLCPCLLSTGCGPEWLFQREYSSVKLAHTWVAVEANGCRLLYPCPVPDFPVVLRALKHTCVTNLLWVRQLLCTLASSAIPHFLLSLQSVTSSVLVEAAPNRACGHCLSSGRLPRHSLSTREAGPRGSHTSGTASGHTSD